MSSPDTAAPRGLQPDQIRLMRLASIASVAVAFVLIIGKGWAWRATDSIALLSSLVDSLLDLAASVVTLFAIRYAVTPADREHRFGHGKSEGIAGLIQSLIIMGSALYVAVEAVPRLLRPEPLEQIGAGLAVMALSLALTLTLYAFQRFVIARTRSLAIAADSVHYQADILTNGAVLIGIFATHRLGWHILDPLLGLVVAGVILVSVRSIAVDAVNVLLDRELPGTARKIIRDIAFAHPAVLGVHDLRTRSSGSMQFIQLHLELDPRLTLLEVHEISDEVETEVQKAFPLAEVLIHADPYGVQESRDAF